MPSGRGIFASSSALESDIDLKVGPVEIERNGAKRIMKIYPEGGAWYS